MVKGVRSAVDDAFPICKEIAECDNQIIITSMLKKNESTGWYVKPKTTVPNEAASNTKIFQAELVTSIIKENESYLGKVSYIHVRQELADVILFPRPAQVVMCVVVQRPYNLEHLTAKVSDLLDAQLNR